MEKKRGGGGMRGESCCFCVAVLVLALWASLVLLVSCSSWCSVYFIYSVSCLL